MAIKVAAVEMFIDEVEESATVFIPIESPVLEMLKDHNNGMEVELNEDHWWQVWHAQMRYAGFQTVEVVEKHGPVCNMGPGVDLIQDRDR